LVIKLEFKDLEKDFFEVFFFHVMLLLDDRKYKYI